MTKTQRVIAAVALAAGASVLSVSGASAAPAAPVPPAGAAQPSPIDQVTGGINQLHQLNALLEVPNQLAALTDPVTGLVGAVQ
ncbi:hypothetical protein GCM10010232_69640 [Streptomyces amakusaensis]|uniref:Secreted protein n=1 Tax=Streptomyces amakusaensis TaxID=67271 RepID=A0ABW0ASZ6_9ACTN